MIATGRFGLITYDLKRPESPRRLDALDNEALRLEGDPPVNFGDADGGGSPDSTYWQNEDMDVDQRRKLVFMARDPRSFAGTTGNDTSVAGVYIVDARDPADLKLLNFTQLATGHTTTCINELRLPVDRRPGQRREPEGGVARRAPDHRHRRARRAQPEGRLAADRPVPRRRRDRLLARRAGRLGRRRVGVRRRAACAATGPADGTSTRSTGAERRASAVDPVPYAGGAFDERRHAERLHAQRGAAGRQDARRRPGAGRRPRPGSLLMATEEADAPPDCDGLAQFAIATLRGQPRRAGVGLDEGAPFRLRTVGTWNPHAQEGTADGVYCSAHYFDVRKRFVAYSWYDQGTRILDISDPTKPIQVAYYRPDGGVSWAPYFHRGLVYVADHERGIEVLRITGGAAKAAAAGKELVAPRISERHRQLVVASSADLRPDPQLGWMCPLPAY